MIGNWRASLIFSNTLPLALRLAGVIRSHGIFDRKTPASFLRDRDYQLRAYLSRVKR